MKANLCVKWYFGIIPFVKVWGSAHMNFFLYVQFVCVIGMG